jgi:hypothetical protein
MIQELSTLKEIEGVQKNVSLKTKKNPMQPFTVVPSEFKPTGVVQRTPPGKTETSYSNWKLP